MNANDAWLLMARLDQITEGSSGVGDRFCAYVRPDGKQCGARRTLGSRYCYFHDPSKSVERTAARRAGGLKNKIAVLPANTPDLRLASPQDVAALVAGTINQVRRGEIDPKVANSIACLTAMLLRAIELAQIEQRLGDLETGVRRR